MKTSFRNFSATLASFLFLQSPAQVYNYAWMKGAPNTSVAVYGTIGVSSPNNTPGYRLSGITWTDQTGTLWLYGGAGFVNSNFTYLSDLWRYSPATNSWTWINGAGSASIAPIYGTIGVSSPLNTPGARTGAASWVDTLGNLWLFGGVGLAGPHNDLWRYSTSTNQWTWMGGTTTPNASPVYGIQGIASSTNVPRASYNLVSWKDPSGNFWLYDGIYGNEVWKYNPATAQWAWMSGTSSGTALAGLVTTVFGTQGVSSPIVHPGERITTGVGDAAGNLYVFGGKIGSSLTGRGNDLWKYSISTNQWTWISGTQMSNHMGTYGTQGVFSATTVPAGRRGGHVLWADNNNKLWLFGGDFLTLVTVYTLNDTWCYDIATGQWAWMKGSNVPFSGNPVDASAVYGTQTVASSSNTPGWRASAVYWINNPFSLWMYSGSALVQSTELWKFNGCSVTPTISISSSHPLLCAGSTATLTASGSVSSFTWNTGAQTNTISVSPSGTTVYSVSGNSSTCNSNSTFTLSVIVPPTLNVSSSSSLSCAGNTVQLTATGAGSYSWNTGQTGASLQASPIVTTVYSVTGTTNNCSTSGTYTQQVVQLPTLHVSGAEKVVCKGEAITLTASGAHTYTWNTTATTGNTIQINPSSTTFLSLTGTDNNGCRNTTLITVNVSDCLGVKSPGTGYDFSIYPNPASNSFNLTGGKGNTLQIVNSLGEIVYKQELEQETTTINIYLTSGIYYCSMSGIGKMVKLIVE